VTQALALCGSFVAAAFALVRYTLRENRSLSDRFTGFLESSLARQEDVNRGFKDAIESLNQTVRDNCALIGRVIERLGA
jgi:hypothetical protein